MKTSAFTRVVVAIIAIFTHLPSVSAQQSDNSKLNLTAAEVTELAAYVTKEKSGKEALAWKKEKDWFQAVIVADGEKITFAYFPKGEGEKPTFSVWWRKAGTTSDKVLWAGGINPDGTVNNGIDPEKKKVALLENTQNPEYRGEQHREYWQGEITKRYRTGLNYFRKK